MQSRLILGDSVVKVGFSIWIRLWLNGLVSARFLVLGHLSELPLNLLPASASLLSPLSLYVRATLTNCGQEMG